MAMTLRPDSKGRVTLGKLANGISGFRVEVDTQRRIILEPLVEIPVREKWLYENPKLLESVFQGIQDAKQKKLKKRGDFSKYIGSEDNE